MSGHSATYQPSSVPKVRAQSPSGWRNRPRSSARNDPDVRKNRAPRRCRRARSGDGEVTQWGNGEADMWSSRIDPSAGRLDPARRRHLGEPNAREGVQPHEPAHASGKMVGFPGR